MIYKCCCSPSMLGYLRNWGDSYTVAGHISKHMRISPGFLDSGLPGQVYFNFLPLSGSGRKFHSFQKAWQQGKRFFHLQVLPKNPRTCSPIQPLKSSGTVVCAVAMLSTKRCIEQRIIKRLANFRGCHAGKPWLESSGNGRLHNKLERSTMLWKWENSCYFDWAMFNRYVANYQKVETQVVLDDAFPIRPHVFPRLSRLPIVRSENLSDTEGCYTVPKNQKGLKM